MTKRKKSIKILIMLLMIIFIIFNSSYICYAGNTRPGQDDGTAASGGGGNTEEDYEGKASSLPASDPTVNPNAWKPGIKDYDYTFKLKVGTILGIINAVGIVVSVIVLAIIGLKYMFGSVEERADYKKSMIPYIIGMTLLGASSTIPNIIYGLVNGINKI